MKKVYLTYDDKKTIAECDYGFIKEIIYMGFFYPLKKKNYKMFYIILSTQIAISLIILLFILPLIAGMIATIFMIIIINILFAANYNMIIIEELLKKGYFPSDYQSSDILIKAGIYFRLQ